MIGDTVKRWSNSAYVIKPREIIMYVAKINIFTDLEQSPFIHTSIIGGKATHSFHEINEIKNESLDKLKEEVRNLYGNEPYDSLDNREYYSIDQKKWIEQECPENYEVSYYEIIKREVIL